MHPMLECNPARDVQVKFFCVRLWLVTLYLLSLHCTWMTNSCLFHTGGKTSFAGSFVSHKRVEDGTCISVTERFIMAPEHRWRCDVWSCLSLLPTESTVVFFGCSSPQAGLSLFIFLKSPIITMCKWTPVHHLSIEFDRTSYATLSFF